MRGRRESFVAPRRDGVQALVIVALGLVVTVLALVGAVVLDEIVRAWS